MPPTIFRPPGLTNTLRHVPTTVIPLPSCDYHANPSAVEPFTRWADTFPRPPALPAFAGGEYVAASYGVLGGFPGMDINWAAAGLAVPSARGVFYPLPRQPHEMMPVETRRVQPSVPPAPHQHLTSPILGPHDAGLRSRGVRLSDAVAVAPAAPEYHFPPSIHLSPFDAPAQGAYPQLTVMPIPTQTVSLDAGTHTLRPGSIATSLLPHAVHPVPSASFYEVHQPIEGAPGTFCDLSGSAPTHTLASVLGSSIMRPSAPAPPVPPAIPMSTRPIRNAPPTPPRQLPATPTVPREPHRAFPFAQKVNLERIVPQRSATPCHTRIGTGLLVARLRAHVSFAIGNMLCKGQSLCLGPAVLRTSLDSAVPDVSSAEQIRFAPRSRPSCSPSGPRPSPCRLAPVGPVAAPLHERIAPKVSLLVLSLRPSRSQHPIGPRPSPCRLAPSPIVISTCRSPFPSGSFIIACGLLSPRLLHWILNFIVIIPFLKDLLRCVSYGVCLDFIFFFFGFLLLLYDFIFSRLRSVMSSSRLIHQGGVSGDSVLFVLCLCFVP